MVRLQRVPDFCAAVGIADDAMEKPEHIRQVKPEPAIDALGIKMPAHRGVMPFHQHQPMAFQTFHDIVPPAVLAVSPQSSPSSDMSRPLLSPVSRARSPYPSHRTPPSCRERGNPVKTRRRNRALVKWRYAPQPTPGILIHDAEKWTRCVPHYSQLPAPALRHGHWRCAET